MSKKHKATGENFARIMEGLAEAAAFIRGEDAPGLIVHIPADIDIKAIRTRLGGLSQADFAGRYGFSVGAVRDWEQGRRMPDPAVRAYLKVIVAEPDTVDRVLAAPAGAGNRSGGVGGVGLSEGGAVYRTKAGAVKAPAPSERLKGSKRISRKSPDKRATA